MQETIIYVFVLALFEIYESSWQRATTLEALVRNIYRRYQKGIFYFFFSHPSFIYTLYLGIKYGLYNFWFMAILFLKFMDISFKLAIIQKLQEGRLHEIMPLPPQTKIDAWMSYINTLLYPLLLYLAFTQNS